MSWQTLVDPALSERICLTLFHSIWQVALLALLAWCVDRLWCRRFVERRYVVHVAALVVALLAMPVTCAVVNVDAMPQAANNNAPVIAATPQVAPSAPLPAVSVPPVPSAASSIPATSVATVSTSADVDEQPTTRAVETLPPTTVEPSVSEPTFHWMSIAPWIVALYAAGVVLMLARLTSALMKANRLVALAEPISDGPLVDALRALARKWSMRAAPLLARSRDIVVPKVVGLMQVTILLPASAVSGLTTHELEMILAHELAHVRRYDMWVNLAQRLAEAVLFFNPPIWYLSRRISTLREYCCDELTCGTPSSSADARLQYAAALLRVAELATTRTRSPVQLASLAATGRSPSEMRRRVARLFGEPLPEPLRVSRGGLLTMMLLALTLTFGMPVWRTHAEAQANEEPQPAATDDNTPIKFELTVLGPDGQPIPQANVEVRTDPPPQAEQILVGEYVRSGRYGSTVKGDAQGNLHVQFAKPPQYLAVAIRQPDYAPYWAEWNSHNHPQPIPSQFTAELDAGWSIGGIVVNDEGQPLAGVSVSPSVYWKKRPGDNEKLGMGSNITTDAEGKWRFHHVPVTQNDVHVSLNHEEYQPLRITLLRNEYGLESGAEPTAKIELPRGLTISGIVTADGLPVEGAVVRTKFLNERREARTNERGEYKLHGCEPRQCRVVVSGKGLALEMQEVRVDPDMAPVNFEMRPGGKVRVRIVDEQGKGIAKSRIFFQRWRGQIDYFEFDHVNQYADENGVWEWNEAPLDEFQADICPPDGMQLLRQPILARAEEYVFRPPSLLIVSGNVVDAKTGQPVKEFRVIPGLRNADPGIRMNWDNRNSFEASDGKYSVRFHRAEPALLVRIEADGYLVAISRDIKSNEGRVSVDFALEPAADIAATVLTSDGQPAADAKIGIGVAGSQISINNGEINDGSTFATRLNTDKQGRFRIPARGEEFQLIVTHPAGFWHWDSLSGPVPEQIQLTPWARAEGVFRVGSQPAANVVLNMNTNGIHSYGNDVANIFTDYQVTTGKDGKFVIDRVFPGTGRIGRRILLMVNEGAVEVTSSHMAYVEFKPGETSQIVLGGNGTALQGKLVAPEGFQGEIDWRFGLIDMRVEHPTPPRPPVPDDVRGNDAAAQAWFIKWKETDAGKAWTTITESYEKRRQTAPYFSASIDRDGTFRIDDVPPGDYTMSVRFHEKHREFGLFDYKVRVRQASGDTLRLGTLTLISR